MLEAKKPWIETPLIESVSLSRAAGCKVHLKIETLQPSGSFKSRGVGYYMLARVRERRQNFSPSHVPFRINFYSSSGGNAGLAAVCAAVTLQLPCTVVVPLSTPALMIDKIREAGASDVIQKGASWKEADAYMREELLAKDKDGVYVPPFDHPDVWEGNSRMIPEICSQWDRERGGRNPPAAIICSVGGGGLLSGLAQGLDRAKWDNVPVIVVETQGAHSLAASLRAKKLVELDAITSEATTLGAKQVAQRAFEVGMQERTKSVVLNDAEAAMGSWRLADAERLLVEMSCGVCIALCFKGRLERALGRALDREEEVVIVVCGGSNVTVDMVDGWKKQYGLAEADEGRLDNGVNGVLAE